MTGRCAGGCGRPGNGTTLCHHCASLLVADLTDLVRGDPDRSGTPTGGLLAELDITITRQAVLGGEPTGIRTRNANPLLPYHESAADIGWTVRNTLTTWTRDVADLNGAEPPTGDASAAAAWLAEHPRYLRRHPAAAELYDELRHAVSCVRIAIDRARDRVYLGPCGAELGDDTTCNDDLYVLPGRDIGQCSACGTHYDVTARREWLLEAVRDQIHTAAEISRALPDLMARKITASMIRGYAFRRRLLPHGTGTDRQPRYRVGDVIDLLTADQTCARPARTV